MKSMSFALMSLLLTATAAAAAEELELSRDEYDEITAAIRYSGEFGRSATARDALCLGTVEGQSNIAGVMTRELARQALLIAAREGLGLATRDRTLREEFGEASTTSGSPVNLAVFQGPGNKFRLYAFRQGERSIEPLWKEEIVWQENEDPFEKVVVACESYSREPFLKALKDAEYTGKPHAVGQGGVPESARVGLGRLDFVSQFAALRMVHGEIAKSGESRERLKALALGYAQLGTMLENCHYLGHVAFKARALLYAERSLKLGGGAPTELWNRALVRALLGYHALALKDVEAARAHPAAKGGEGEPKWGGAIDAMCRFDTKTLDPYVKDPATRPLAVYLKLLMSEYSNSRPATALAAADCFEVHSDCLRALFASQRLSDLSIARTVAEQGPLLFRRAFYRHLSDIPGLPESAAEPARERVEGEEVESDDTELRPRILDSLAKAGRVGDDKSEPSLALFAQIARETTFREVYNELIYLRAWLSSPTEERRVELQPLTRGHRHEPLLATLGESPDKIRPRSKQLLSLFHPVEADLLDWVLARYAQMDSGFIADWNVRTIKHLDYPGHAMQTMLTANDETERRAFERKFFETTPHSPQAVATRIRSDWKSVEPRAAELEARYADVVAVLTALAQRYAADKKFDDATRCYRRCIELSPDFDTYRGLAEAYRLQEKFDDWKGALDDALKLPARGLSHAQIQVQIARHHMGRKEWEAALPYANAAAETYAAWAMMCASECEEGLEHWDESEAWIRRVSERYRDQTTAWYFWCHRTGHGDEAAARKFTEQYFESLPTPAPNNDLRRIAMYYLIEKQNEPALEVFKAEFEKSHDPYMGLHAALVADELKNPELRESLLKTVAEKGHEARIDDQPRKLLMRVAEQYRATMARRAINPKATLTLKVVDAERLAAQPAENSIADYFLGRIFARFGDDAQSQKYYQLAATTPFTDRMTVAHASTILRAKKVAIGPRREKELEGIEPRKIDVANERRVAEWVLSLEGHVEIALENGQRQSVAKLPFPESPFAIVTIYIAEKKGLTDEGLKSLAGLKELESLQLREDLTYEGLKSIEGLQSMKRLTLAGTLLTDKALAIVGTFSNLESLDAQGSWGKGGLTEKAIAGIAKLTQLRRLNLVEQEFTDEGLSHLEGMTALQELVISNHRRTVPKITDAGLAHLRDMVEMRNLQLCNSSITDEGLKHLAGMKELTNLNIAINRIHGEGLKHIEGRKLVHLDVSSSALTDAGLAHLQGMVELRNLQLWRTAITDEGLKHLAGMKELTNLNINTNKLSGTGLKYVTGEKLTNVDLSWSEASDAGLKEATRFSKLTQIGLARASLTDDGALELRKLTSLTSANLTHIALRKATVESLQMALPKCKIEVSAEKLITP